MITKASMMKYTAKFTAVTSKYQTGSWAGATGNPSKGGIDKI